MNRYNYFIVAFLVAFLAASSASPIAADNCTVTTFDAVAAAAKTCMKLTVNGITVPGGQLLEIKLKDGATLRFKGNITFDYGEWAGPMVVIRGKGVTVNGNGAIFNGQGEKYWDGLGAKGILKPKFFRIKTTGGSKVSHIHLLNCPVHCVSVNTASDTALNDFLIDVSAGSEGNPRLGKNTDGFGLSSSSNISIKNSVVMNQDDCVVVNQGSNYLFKNLTCIGGHGISLSVGQSKENGTKNTVSNITFSDCSVIDSRNGIHVKTHTDAGTGIVSDVTYKNIFFSGNVLSIRKVACKFDDERLLFASVVGVRGITHYGVNIQQDYSQGKSTGTPNNNIPVVNLVLKSVTGTLAGISNSMPIFILCGDGSCQNWPWTNVNVTNGVKKNKCNYDPIGFQC